MLVVIYSFRYLIVLEDIQVFIEGLGVWGLLAYFFIYTFLVLFGFPSAVLTVMAGAVFGIFLGFMIDFVASMFTASVSYFFAYFFQKRFSRRMQSSDNAKFVLDYFNKEAKNNGFVGVLLLRFSFVPFIVISYVAGLLKGVRFSEFFAATVISNAVFGFLIVYLGYGFLTGDGVWLSLGIFFSILLLSYLFKRNKYF